MAQTLQEVAAKANLTDFDDKTLIKDLDSVMALREEVSSENQRLGEKYKLLEKDRGYHLQAFKQLVKLKKTSPEGAADFMRTFMAGVRALGLMPADMLDKAEADKANGKATGTKLARRLDA